MTLVPQVTSPAVVVSGDCRALRRSLRPLVWVVLEEVALDAVADAGRLVAHTSARQVAERLGIDPGSSARALQVLRRRGLLRSVADPGPAERFGLSVYQLRPATGLTVVHPAAVGEAPAVASSRSAPVSELSRSAAAAGLPPSLPGPGHVALDLERRS